MEEVEKMENGLMFPVLDIRDSRDGVTKHKCG